MAISDGTELVNDVWLRWFSAIKQSIEDLSAQVSSGGGGLGDLTRVNDTNVTLTLGGTPTGALFQNVSLTLGWTGTLVATRGGTGHSSYTLGDILRADSTTTLAAVEPQLWGDFTPVTQTVAADSFICFPDFVTIGAGVVITLNAGAVLRIF